MIGIDDDIVFFPGRYAGHDQYGRAAFFDPCTTELPGDELILIVPAWKAVFGDDFVARAGRQVDGDEVLVRRQDTVVMHEFFEHGGTVMLAGVNDRLTFAMPAAIVAARAVGAVDWPPAARVADAPDGEWFRQFANRHQTAMPASALSRSFRTRSAPAVDSRATSNGVRPSSSGCSRDKNSDADS